jgi:hypothetical protein
MRLKRLRPAFSMLTAIFVLVLMIGVSALVFDLSGKIVKETTTQYKKEQAVLLAKSYTELTILAVMANSRGTNPCLYNITGNNILGDNSLGFGYRVRVRIGYIGNNLGNCNATANVYANNVVTPESMLNIIVDTYIEYQEDVSVNDTISNAQWITYHRRTLQRI